VSECTSGADGTCSASDLPFGTYYWRETAAPAGYLLPDSPVSDPIVIGADVAGTDLPVTVFNDTPTGSLSITKEVDKATAKFGDTLTYTLHLHAVGPQLQSDVTVTDFVPGYDPADTTSWKVTYIDGSASCSVTCTTSYDGSSHLLTWKLTNPIPEPSDVDLTFKATIDTPPADANGGRPAETIFNTAVVTSNHTPPTRSNKVKTVVVAVLGEKVVRPEPAPLPFTGPTVPPQMASVVALLLIGTGIVLTAVRRRREAG